MIERQELHCHACNQYVQFDIEMEIDGNHVLKCPNCGHEHCRVVKNGIITGERWAQRNGSTIPISTFSTTFSSTSTYTSYSMASKTYTGDSFIYSSWLTSITST